MDELDEKEQKTNQELSHDQKINLQKAKELLVDGLDLYEQGLRFKVTKALEILRQI